MIKTNVLTLGMAAKILHDKSWVSAIPPGTWSMTWRGIILIWPARPYGSDGSSGWPLAGIQRQHSPSSGVFPVKLATNQLILIHSPDVTGLFCSCPLSRKQQHLTTSLPPYSTPRLLYDQRDLNRNCYSKQDQKSLFKLIRLCRMQQIAE